MARPAATLGEAARITDYLSLGVITSACLEQAIRTALAATGRSSVRERALPAQVVMYYVSEQAGFMSVSQREVLRCLLAGVRWLFGPQVALKVTGKSGISQARSRLGWEPVKQLHDAVVKPIAIRKTRGAWYRNWQLVSLDGSTLEVADSKANRAAFGRPGVSRGRSAYPQIRLVSLVEHGPHVLFGTAMGGYATGEYVGGAIAPGLEISMNALVEHAAKLYRVELIRPRDVVGRTTVGAIQSGLIYGYTALVDGMIERIIRERSENTHVIATGGFAELIAPESEMIEDVDEFLTLKGLRLIFERNRRL